MDKATKGKMKKLFDRAPRAGDFGYLAVNGVLQTAHATPEAAVTAAPFGWVEYYQFDGSEWQFLDAALAADLGAKHEYQMA